MTLSRELTNRLASTRTIELTTTGRRSGRPRRIEIWWFHFNGKFVISGTPGRRDWLANIRSDNSIVVHVDGGELEATAHPIADDGFRRAFFNDPQTRWYSTQEALDRLVAEAPMVEIRFG